MEEFALFQWFQWTNMQSKFQYMKLKQVYNDTEQAA